MNPEITLLYVHGSAIGYGRLGVHLAGSLAARGVDVYDSIENPHGVETHSARLLELAESEESYRPRAKRTNTVCWVSVPTHARGWWAGQHAAIFTMWEAQTLPPAFRENLHAFDTVIVPSAQNVELFGRYHDNVHLCLLGVDPQRWHYLPRSDPGVFFNFLAGGSGSRKGIDLVVRAFQTLWGGRDRSWGDGPIPRLILKNPKGERYRGERIEMISGRISTDDEVDLYAQAHCYVQPSRGEGFGLQPLQAIAQGLPTILTDAHGHASFAHLGYGIPATDAKADYFIYGDAGNWWEPNFDDLCDRMRWVYDHYDSACDDAKRSAEEVATSWTWDQTATRFVDILGDHLRSPYAGPGTWLTPQLQHFKVVVNRTWTADIAGQHYQFLPGREYWEPADVKRMMFEGGLLDPVCLEGDDTGLTASQIANIGDYSARHGHCVTCGQPLGGRTRADDIYDELARAVT